MFLITSLTFLLCPSTILSQTLVSIFQIIFKIFPYFFYLVFSKFHNLVFFSSIFLSTCFSIFLLFSCIFLKIFSTTSSIFSCFFLIFFIFSTNVFLMFSSITCFHSSLFSSNIFLIFIKFLTFLLQLLLIFMLRFPQVSIHFSNRFKYP